MWIGVKVLSRVGEAIRVYDVDRTKVYVVPKSAIVKYRLNGALVELFVDATWAEGLK